MEIIVKHSKLPRYVVKLLSSGTHEDIELGLQHALGYADNCAEYYELIRRVCDSLLYDAGAASNRLSSHAVWRIYYTDNIDEFRKLKNKTK